MMAPMLRYAPLGNAMGWIVWYTIAAAKKRLAMERGMYTACNLHLKVFGFLENLEAWVISKLITIANQKTMHDIR